MKDVDYFLNAEQEYRKTPIPDMIYNEEFNEFEDSYEPLHFLRRGRFKHLSEIGFDDNAKYNTHYKQYGLTDVEILMLRCFYADISWAFRDDAYRGEVPELVKEMQNVLENVVRKALIYDGNTLYRNIRTNDPDNLNVGDVYCPTHSLTTSIDEFDKDETSYIITCLPNNMTKAHCLFKIYHHGNEKQVNFPRGTRFQVTKIVNKSKGVKKIYMNELEDK